MRVWSTGAAVIRPYWQAKFVKARCSVCGQVMTGAVIIAGLFAILCGRSAGSEVDGSAIARAHWSAA